MSTRKRATGKPGKWIREDKREAIYCRAERVLGARLCTYCECSTTRPIPNAPRKSDATLDHVKPRDRGGNNTERNLVLACQWCNSNRAALSVSDFCLKVGADRVKVQKRIKAQVMTAIDRALGKLVLAAAKAA